MLAVKESNRVSFFFTGYRLLLLAVLVSLSTGVFFWYWRYSNWYTKQIFLLVIYEVKSWSNVVGKEKVALHFTWLRLPQILVFAVGMHFYFLIKKFWVTLVAKIMEVSKVQFYNITPVDYIICSSPKVKSLLSPHIWPLIFSLPQLPFKSGNPHTIVCVYECLSFVHFA